MRIDHKSVVWRFLLFLPIIASIFLFVLPQYFFLSMGFRENLGYGRIGDHFTLSNFQTILSDGFYWQSFLDTLVLAGATAIACLLIGFPAAYILGRSRSRWIALLVGLLFASAFITAVVKDLGLIILLSDGGVVNKLLMILTPLNGPVRFLGTELGVFIGLLHYTLPLSVLVLYTVVQMVPPGLEDAAAVHGARRMRVFFTIIIPLAANGLLSAGLMVFNLAMGAFTTPLLLGGGRVITFPVVIQRAILLDVNYPAAAGASFVMLVIVILINIIAGYLVLCNTRLNKSLRSSRGVR